MSAIKKTTGAEDLSGVTTIENHHTPLNDERRGNPSGSAGGRGEVLAQAIEVLSVREKGANSEPTRSNDNGRAFSPSAISSLPPIGTASGSSIFNSRSASPMAESVSPTFGGGAGQPNSSPSTSQVSVGSVGPTLVASLLNQRHHYDLTPVMRNTATNDNRPVEKGRSYARPRTDISQRMIHHGTHSVVSPETVDEEKNDFLHGEHLSLPADLSSSAGDEGPILPNLRKTTIPTLPMQRAKSLGVAGLAHLSETEIPHLSDKPPPAPVEFPSERKFYSFTSREQYKGLQENDDDDLSEEESLGERPDLTPYQPSRQEFAEIEESLPPEELESIFIARRRRSSVRQNVVIEGVLREEDEESSHKNHRLLQNPIPMTDRQWSIPSLRMAHRLATDGSLASLTDHPDEDESLLFVRPCGDGADMTDEDEASISSRASSLYMSIGGTAGVVPTSIPLSIAEPQSEQVRTERNRPIWNDDVSSSLSQLPSIGSSSLEGVQSFGSAPPEATKVVLESPWNILSGTQSSLSDENSAVAVDGDRAMRRKRKQRQREEAALSWLQSLQEQSKQPAVAEAASSKFLTGRTQTAFRKPNDDSSSFAAIKEEVQRHS